MATSRGSGWRAALRDSKGGTLLGVSRSKSNLAEAFANEFNAKKWWPDWREMCSGPEVDAVYVATPVHLHSEQAIYAAERGKNVLCEKPMAINVAQCDRMIDAAQANNVKLGVAYYRRFYPVVQRIKQILAGGDLGRPVLVQINAFGWFYPAPDDPRQWFIQKDKAGGGPMLDVGCHRIEVLLNIFGGIKRTTSALVNLAFNHSVEDTGVSVMELEQGVIAVLTVTQATQEAQDTLDIYCTKGSIHVPVLNCPKLTVRIVDRGD